jgi:hypothetical protein
LCYLLVEDIILGYLLLLIYLTILGTRDLALILKATIDEDNEELNIDSGEDKEEIELNVVEKGERKRQMMSELDSLVPILKTSSLSRIGRDDVWKQLQSVIGY